MKQRERRIYLIQELLKENQAYSEVKIPETSVEQKQLLRGLMNIRLPRQVGEEFLKIQDEYLQEEIRRKGITETDSLIPVQEEMYLWQGDITTLRCDAIVNAANSQMLGCFCPNHGCIDNAIHTFSGIQLREACAKLMEEQGQEEKTGEAKITPAFNLPCNYVIHTVGPIVGWRLTENDKKLLASCYRSCLELAEKHGVRSIAFCCISTGEFHFPNERAAQIAVDTVKEFMRQDTSVKKVVFNVFKELDREIYSRLLG